MSRTGVNSNRAFTLIEVLVAVLILAIGIIGVIRSYIVLMNGIEASQFTVEASYLLKDRMADIEKGAIENSGAALSDMNGSFNGKSAAFRREEESSEVTISAKSKESETSADKDKEGETKASAGEVPKEIILTKVRVTVLSGKGLDTGRKASLYTYLENYSE